MGLDLYLLVCSFIVTNKPEDTHTAPTSKHPGHWAVLMDRGAGYTLFQWARCGLGDPDPRFLKISKVQGLREFYNQGRCVGVHKQGRSGD